MKVFAVLGLAVVAGTLGTDEPVAGPRGTLRVCVDGQPRPGGYDAFAEGPSARGTRIEAGRCVGWKVRPGAYQTGVVVEPDRLLTGYDATCPNASLRWRVSRPGLVRSDDYSPIVRTNVLADQTTEVRWTGVGDCNPHQDSTAAPPAKTRDAAVAESREAEAAERAEATGTLEVCESAERESLPRILVRADGPSARSAILEPNGLSGCLRFAVRPGWYPLEARGIARYGYDDCDLNDVALVYVPAGETRTASLEHECYREEA